MKYSIAFKNKMIQKMAGPQAITATALSRQIDLPQSTLSRWLREAAKLEPLTTHDTNFTLTRTQEAMMPRRPQDWPAEEKLKIVLEANALTEDKLGAFLRSKGIHEAQLRQWRSQMLAGLKETNRGKASKKSDQARRIRELEKDLSRKDKALAETAALLVLKKKAHAIWGDEDSDMKKSNGK